MGLPRSKYVTEGQEGIYHCFSRCVRRAFLYGHDALTGRDFSHRKAWLVDRLRYLAAIFAIEVCAYAIMENHYHSILRTRPDIVAAWSDHEVATRWLTLFPPPHNPRDVSGPPSEEQISALTACPERIAELRRRLCSLSWFMGCLNEFIARAANKEDGVKGHFWEARFKCQALLDDAAIATCMVYVDLNPIRAGLAATPEDSDFTGIQERIRAWYNERMLSSSVPADSSQNTLSVSAEIPESADAGDNSITIPTRSLEPPISSSSWLCPIQSDSQHRGILPMSTAEYLDLVDKSGRILRPNKQGAIDPDLAPILLRIGANPKTWQDTISHFGSRFCLAAGLVSNLRNFADRISRRWLKGISTAKASFCTSPPQLA